MLHTEHPLTILVFSVNDPLPDLQNFTQNGEIGLEPRCRDEIRIKLKHRTCTITFYILGTLINNYIFFGLRPFSRSHKVSTISGEEPLT